MDDSCDDCSSGIYNVSMMDLIMMVMDAGDGDDGWCIRWCR